MFGCIFNYSHSTWVVHCPHISFCTRTLLCYRSIAWNYFFKCSRFAMPLTMLVLSFFDPRSSRARDRNCSNTAKSKNYFSFLISLPLKLMSLLSFLAVIYKLFFLSINIKNHHRNLQKRVGDVHQKNPHWDFLNHNCSFPSQKVFLPCGSYWI